MVPLLRLHVEGANIVDATGRAVRLRGVHFPIGTFPCPTSAEIDKYIQKAAEWGFNNIEVSLEITRFYCKQDQIGLAEEVARRANRLGLYVTVRMGARRKTTGPNQSNLYFTPTQKELDSYVEFWRQAGTRFRNNPGVAAVQLYNELSYGNSGAERAPFWSMVQDYNVRACAAVREGSPDMICTVVSADTNQWYPDTWGFGSPSDYLKLFSGQFPPPNSLIAIHPYYIRSDREAACQQPASPDTWWCYPVNRPWEFLPGLGKAIIFSEVGYFETGASIGEPYVETIDAAALRLKVAEDLGIPWDVLGPFWSWKDGRLYWVGGGNSDDALWNEVVGPLLDH